MAAAPGASAAVADFFTAADRVAAGVFPAVTDFDAAGALLAVTDLAVTDLAVADLAVADLAVTDFDAAGALLAVADFDATGAFRAGAALPATDPPDAEALGAAAPRVAVPALRVAAPGPGDAAAAVLRAAGTVFLIAEALAAADPAGAAFRAGLN